MQEKIYCHICNTLTGYKNWNYFIDRHIKGHHKLNFTKKEYIEKYNVIIDDSKERIKCLICGEQTDLVIDSFSRYHLKIYHPEIKDIKEYYDMYIKKEGEGICFHCGKETKFKSYYRGYAEHCSLDCSRNSSLTAERIKQAKIELYADPIKKEQILKKFYETSMERYGGYYQTTNEYKEKAEKTCLEKYGVTCTLYLDSVTEARNKALEENKEEINEKRKAFWTEENIERVNRNREESVYEKYGVYHVSQLDEFYDKVRETNENNGRWKSLDDTEEFEKYRNDVNSVSRKLYKRLFQEWNGLDYYTKEILNDDSNVVENDPKKIPSVDHKISVFYGFINNISPEEIGRYENLCICSKSTNSCKNLRCEEEFLEYLKNNERI